MLIDFDNDSHRYCVLQALREPDASRDDVLHQFVQLASQVLGIPGSFISVLDDSDQYIQAAHNFVLKQTAREDALCRYVADNDAEIVVPDTLLDSRFMAHRYVTDAPFIRFYAGVPLKDREGRLFGTLCVTDGEPHTFSVEQLLTLKKLANLMMSFLEAWHAAGFTDPATGMPNRQRLMRDLQYLADSGDVSLRRLVLIDCIDMPRAYELARSMGMGPVETLLKNVAALLPRLLLPASDERLYTVTTGRFALLTHGKSPLSAASIAERLTGMSAELGEGLSLALSTHTGQVDFTAGCCNAQEILRRAASALYEATGSGTPAMAYTESADVQQGRDFKLMREFAAALHQEGGLYLVYQPKICLRTGAPVGLEALIRWCHPEHGELLPGAFVPLAEKTGQLPMMTTWVIDRAILRLAHLRDKGIQLPITVNISLNDFACEGFADDLERKLNQYGLPPSLLGIECLETERILESSQAMQGLERLKQRGFTISLDDFGTGYSNISYLRQMPLDVIKLDRSLISNLSTDTASRIIACSIINMLKALDYVVLAEGVEDAETGRILSEYGSDQAQGYFYSRPMAEKALDAWLLRKRAALTE